MSQEKPISGFRDRLAALRRLMDSDSLKGFVGCTTFSTMFQVLCARSKKAFWNRSCVGALLV
ncbi:hypothetical protein DD238_007423 [Peronospora effusa]|uniref:Uncharacterized protein n=1 Tax=Peronospora effusa TaxID=542832 RepID=A0A3M6VBB0_9STRA|nr:hypothetical protein DD238_007423 [Peronospora effusa]